MIAAFAASLPHHLPNPPRPRRLGPLPRCGVAAPRLLRAARPAHRAGGARRAARADDDPPGVARPLRPPPAAGAGDAAHLALRLGQRRPRVPPPHRALLAGAKYTNTRSPAKAVSVPRSAEGSGALVVLVVHRRTRRSDG